MYNYESRIRRYMAWNRELQEKFMKLELRCARLEKLLHEANAVFYKLPAGKRRNSDSERICEDLSLQLRDATEEKIEVIGMMRRNQANYTRFILSHDLDITEDFPLDLNELVML